MKPNLLASLLAGIAAAGMTPSAGAVGPDDARSIGLGGSAIANGQGVMGALQNPSSLLEMQRQGKTSHTYFGAVVDLRTPEGTQDLIDDESDEHLVDDLETEFDLLDERVITCDASLESNDDVCLDDLENFNDLGNRLLRIIDLADGNDFAGQGHAGIGVALTGGPVPLAIHFGARVTGIATAEIDPGDREYVATFEEITDDGTITWGEVLDSSYLVQNGNLLTVNQPQDTLLSTGESAVLYRTELSVALARSFGLGKRTLDVGITPKISQLKAQSADVALAEEFERDTASISDRLEDSEVSETSFTLDVGFGTRLDPLPLRLSAVVRNLVPESIETRSGYEFETTPQLIIGGHYELGNVDLTTDLALNSATVDGIDTRIAAIGIEHQGSVVALRAGLSIDSERDVDETAISLGLGLGPLQFSARATGEDALQAGAQLSWSF
ncbi:MAG: hypothetical protein CSB44_11340 [Gammaproteobacteria bacterium]|nr:MAG: hypothetical protein CSB44_11340 [Gammaproteobacteria bacterium]